MKRSLCDCDAVKSKSSPKRRKTQCADIGAPRSPSPSPPHSHLSFQTEDSIQHWVDSCPSVSDPKDMMTAAPPTPRSAFSSNENNHGRRRSAKRQARSHSQSQSQSQSHSHSQASRTPSPSKKPSPQTYRTRNMYHAGVFVDSLGDLDLVPAIDDEVRRILGIDSWEDPVTAAVEESQIAHLNGLIATFRAESRRNARDCSLEGDWKAGLNSLVKNLADLWPGSLKTHMSEKVWNSDLKPTAPSSQDDDLDDHDDSGTRTPRLVPTTVQTSLPEFDPSGAVAVAPTFPFAGPIPSLPASSYAPSSAAPTTSTGAADPYHISTPKPDITVGLAHTAFPRRHQRRLVDHQASGSILSDPNAADMGIRFPFLVVEAKGMGLNGSLVAAQNQAAISGACMLTIQKDLTHQAVWNAGILPSTSTQSSPFLSFSIVTEGPAHELWVHCEHEGAFHMEFLQSWRTTRDRDARGLAIFLTRIMHWGKGRFKHGIEEKLDKVPAHSPFN